MVIPLRLISLDANVATMRRALWLGRELRGYDSDAKHNLNMRCGEMATPATEKAQN
jgi:hypothetical protein